MGQRGEGDGAGGEADAAGGHMGVDAEAPAAATPVAGSKR